MQPRILIADNDHAVGSLLAQVASRLRCGVTTVHDGEAAMRELEAADYAVLVCDLDMPKVSGAALLEWLAKACRPTRAIVVSGFVDAAVERRLLSLGVVTGILRKPFDLGVFLERVRDALPPPAQRAVP